LAAGKGLVRVANAGDRGGGGLVVGVEIAYESCVSTRTGATIVGGGGGGSAIVGIRAACWWIICSSLGGAYVFIIGKKGKKGETSPC